jgi:hypothetical protein
MGAQNVIYSPYDVVRRNRMIDKNGFISIRWHIDDVICRAEDMETPVTREQAIEILEIAENCHDACYGISWETFDVYIDDILREQQREEYKSWLRLICMEGVAIK